MRKAWVLAGLIGLSFAGCVPESGGPDVSCDRGVARYKAEVAAEHPHPNVFSEGLVYRDGIVYESFGPQGRGGIIRYRLGSRSELGRTEVDESSVFPEGLSWRGDQLIQLTEKSQVAYLYDPQTLEREGTLPFAGTGWGLATDGRQLIRGDGTSTLYFHDPRTLAVVRTVQVTEAGKPVVNLNELEWVQGRVYANIWYKNSIVVIDPETGRVEATIDTSAVTANETRLSNDWVINGIAHVPERGRLLLTGKRWGSLYEVEFASLCEARPAASPSP